MNIAISDFKTVGRTRETNEDVLGQKPAMRNTCSGPGLEKLNSQQCKAIFICVKSD